MQKTAVRESVDIKEFKENIDAWVKKINTDFSHFRHIPTVIDESLDNIQHNYELVKELRQEVEDLKQELRLLKAIQFVILKKGIR